MIVCSIGCCSGLELLVFLKNGIGNPADEQALLRNQWARLGHV